MCGGGDLQKTWDCLGVSEVPNMWRGWSLTLALVLLLASATYCQDSNTNVNLKDDNTQVQEYQEYQAPALVEDVVPIETKAETKSQNDEKANEQKSAENMPLVPQKQEDAERLQTEAELLKQQRLAEVERIMKKEKVYGK